MLALRTHDQYLALLKKMTASLNDSHAEIEDESINNYSVYKLPFQIEIAGNLPTIVHVNDSISSIYGITKGDQIEQIDYKPIAYYWSVFEENVSFSSPQAGLEYFKVFLWHYFNQHDGSVVLSTMRRGYKLTQAVELLSLSEFRKLYPWNPPTGDARRLAGDVGYIDANGISFFKVGRAYRTLRTKSALIIDCRGYNSGLGALRLLAPLRKNEEPALIYHKPDLANPGNFRSGKALKYSFPRLDRSYNGSLIVLINARARSAMESFLMAVKAQRPTTIFIGSPTNGTNGQKSLVLLPGGVKAWFTGVEVRNPDGSQFQRRGIQPDIFVEPTLESIANGQDIVLQKAIELLLQN